MIKKLICRLFGHVHIEEMYADTCRLVIGKKL